MLGTPQEESPRINAPARLLSTLSATSTACTNPLSAEKAPKRVMFSHFRRRSGREPVLEIQHQEHNQRSEGRKRPEHSLSIDMLVRGVPAGSTIASGLAGVLRQWRLRQTASLSLTTRHKCNITCLILPIIRKPRVAIWLFPSCSRYV